MHKEKEEKVTNTFVVMHLSKTNKNVFNKYFNILKVFPLSLLALVFRA